MTGNNHVAAIILAAGKGVRMKTKKVNKVVLPLVGKPMIRYATDLCEKSGIDKIIIVVGFAKNSIQKILGGRYIYAEQKSPLGTADAVSAGLKYLPHDFKDVLVFYADHCAFYKPKQIIEFINLHRKTKSPLTFITVESDDPFGYGRILRDNRGEVLGIVEEKNASLKEKKIKEINPGVYCFQTDFLKKYLPKVRKNKISGEYYLTDLVEIGILNRERIKTLQVKDANCALGVNTQEECQKAEKLIRRLQNGN